MSTAGERTQTDATLSLQYAWNTFHLFRKLYLLFKSGHTNITQLSWNEFHGFQKRALAQLENHLNKSPVVFTGWTNFEWNDNEIQRFLSFVMIAKRNKEAKVDFWYLWRIDELIYW